MLIFVNDGVGSPRSELANSLENAERTSLAEVLAEAFPWTMAERVVLGFAKEFRRRSIVRMGTPMRTGALGLRGECIELAAIFSAVECLNCWFRIVKPWSVPHSPSDVT